MQTNITNPARQYCSSTNFFNNLDHKHNVALAKQFTHWKYKTYNQIHTTFPSSHIYHNGPLLFITLLVTFLPRSKSQKNMFYSEREPGNACACVCKFHYTKIDPTAKIEGVNTRPISEVTLLLMLLNQRDMWMASKYYTYDRIVRTYPAMNNTENREMHNMKVESE